MLRLHASAIYGISPARITTSWRFDQKKLATFSRSPASTALASSIPSSLQKSSFSNASISLRLSTKRLALCSRTTQQKLREPERRSQFLRMYYHNRKFSTYSDYDSEPDGPFIRRWRIVRNVLLLLFFLFWLWKYYGYVSTPNGVPLVPEYIDQMVKKITASDEGEAELLHRAVPPHILVPFLWLAMAVANTSTTGAALSSVKVYPLLVMGLRSDNDWIRAGAIVALSGMAQHRVLVNDLMDQYPFDKILRHDWVEAIRNSLGTKVEGVVEDLDELARMKKSWTTKPEEVMETLNRSSEAPEELSIEDARERAALIDADPNVISLRAAARMAASFAAMDPTYVLEEGILEFLTDWTFMDEDVNYYTKKVIYHVAKDPEAELTESQLRLILPILLDHEAVDGDLATNAEVEESMQLIYARNTTVVKAIAQQWNMDEKELARFESSSPTLDSVIASHQEIFHLAYYTTLASLCYSLPLHLLSRRFRDGAWSFKSSIKKTARSMLGAASLLGLALASDKAFEWAKAQPVTNAILWTDMAAGTLFTSAVFLSFQFAPHSVVPFLFTEFKYHQNFQYNNEALMARLLPFTQRNEIIALRRESQQYFKTLRDKARADREKKEAAKEAKDAQKEEKAPTRRVYAEQRKDLAIQERRLVAPPVDLEDEHEEE